MIKVKSITSFAFALFIASSICISSTSVQAKGITLASKTAMVATKQSKLSGASIISYAKKFIGIPYKRGGTTTSGFDCSGFTKHVFSNFKINLPRTAKSQTSKGTVVSKSNLRAGDLVFFGRTINHVGVYVGNGKIIHSPKPGSRIKIAELKYMANYNTARRIT